MRIAIPDDYQDIVHRLKCFELLRGHEVLRFREPARDADELAERLADAQVVVAIRERVAFPRSLLKRLPKLELLALVGRHSKVIDFPACKDLGIDVIHGSNASPASPAELTLALILASRRNIATEAERMKRGELPRALSHRLRGSTLGVLGLGTIGALVAAAGAGMGMRILVFGREASLAKAREVGYQAAKSKAQLFEEADVLTLQVRLTPETRGSVTREDLGRMKPSALFVNTARAELVQPGALLESLRSGRPGYAALDVYEEEPVPQGHPLLAMPNVLCTPHLGWAEYDNFELYFGECFEQIARWAKAKTKA
ncbi:MAG TPA: D-2-hydroxyacid dehydrogenase family protein [Burkholderiales bacterium]|jgi:D-3-phosphoglycerate dehydrogenase|nr:D-2-hydroxyacid dehydrogenase family protein [Burkholderiales bacterium]